MAKPVHLTVTADRVACGAHSFTRSSSDLCAVTCPNCTRTLIMADREVSAAQQRRR